VSQPLESAEKALELVMAEPRNASKAASAALVLARETGDAEAASVAERALGLAARELHDITGAVDHLRAAVRIAARARLELRAAQARMSLCLALAYKGDTPAALREADRAAPALRGVDAARLLMQRALILQRLGRLDEALEGYRRALVGFRRANDRVWQARLLNNRGVLHAYRGAQRAAEADLLNAERLYTELGQDLAAAQVRWGRGFAAARGGDVVAALDLYDRAVEDHEQREISTALILLDRCELLMSVRLTAEARRDAGVAVKELSDSNMAFDLAEARLMLAQAELLDGDAAAARKTAAAVAQTFGRQGRKPWAALARYVTLKAAWVEGDRSAATLGAARRAADTLAGSGWPVPALDARLIAARIALERNQLRVAAAELTRAGRARKSGSVEVRARAWHAQALLRRARGDRRSAYSALRAGLAALEEHRESLGATELRVHVAGHGEELASTGVEMALEDGVPDRVLVWAELYRVRALRRRPTRPPDDASLRAELAELRAIVGRISEAALEGRGAAPLRRRQAELEARIQAHARRAYGIADAHLEAAVDLDELRKGLGERALVEIVQSQGHLHAVAVANGRVTLRYLGPLAPVVHELESLRFSLKRLSLGRSSPRSLEIAESTARGAAARLDELLLAPTAADVGDRPLVIVPTGALHALPWGALPSCVTRPVTVSPSARLWLGANARRAGPLSRVALVAGPGLPGATIELAALAPLYRGAPVLADGSARVSSVMSALSTSSFVHLAAHGTFRADNPQFSSLQLVDGPLTVYDLEALAAVPEMLVLSACDSGLSAVRPGDEIMGLAAALFSLGTSTLVATVIPVPDHLTAALMLEFHEGLRSGLPPSVALASARSNLASEPGAALAASAGFVCLGAG
jgi:tetratricopeptide (TPR) repeat protein